MTPSAPTLPFTDLPEEARPASEAASLPSSPVPGREDMKHSARVVLEALEERGEGDALTLAIAVGQQRSCTAKRLSELREWGYVRVLCDRPGTHGRAVQIFVPTWEGKP